MEHRLKGKVQRVYLRYYDGCPVRFKEGSVYSKHSLLKKNGAFNEDEAINLRKGILIYKKISQSYIGQRWLNPSYCAPANSGIQIYIKKANRRILWSYGVVNPWYPLGPVSFFA